jgi:hypothetical protein
MRLVLDASAAIEVALDRGQARRFAQVRSYIGKPSLGNPGAIAATPVRGCGANAQRSAVS